MNISIIAAIGKNNELGKKGDLIWKLPNDLKNFKKITEGHTIIMGRKTFESIGKILPNRKNIIITRNKKFKVPGVEIAHSLKEALSMSRLNLDTKEVFIIGGGEIYKEAMKIAQKLYITHIDAEDKEADTFFPEIIPIVFGEVSREKHKKDAKNPHNYDFVEYVQF